MSSLIISNEQTTLEAAVKVGSVTTENEVIGIRNMLFLMAHIQSC